MAIALSLSLREELKLPDALERVRRLFIPAVPAVKPAPVVKPASVRLQLVIQFKIVLIDENWCEVQRLKIGARTNRKPRKMRTSQLDHWLWQIEQNGYVVREMNLTGLYATATQRI